MKGCMKGCLYYFLVTIGAIICLVFTFNLFAPETARNVKNEVIERVFGVEINKNDSIVTLPRIEVIEDTIKVKDEYDTLKIEVEGNVTYVFAEVNGVPMRFILDTGCTDVQMTVAEFYALKHMGLASDDDLGDKVKCMYANGEEGECHTFNVKTLKLGSLVLNDVNCTVEENIDGPLLLGQTVLQKLGEVTIDYNEKVIKVRNVSK